ncbi:MAG: 3-deoxy-D-manno-octulosonic acid transferase [bacterium]|nr:3-deoxy-D-manno-octulosonic acid transferase [bacterium]
MFLYNFLITTLVILGFPFLLIKLITTEKYRPGAAQRLGFYPREALLKMSGHRPLWVHAVSVGEVIAAAPLVRELRVRYPEKRILVTTVTATGNRTARSQIKEADAVLFFPFDLYPVVAGTIRRIDPALFVLMETEIWPNCVAILHRMAVPMIVVNGRISQSSYTGYSRIRFLMERLLPMISVFSMQTAEDGDRIVNLGAPRERVVNSGNIKFDRQIHPLAPEDIKKTRADYGLPATGPVLIAGSTHRGEESALIDTFVKLGEEFKDLSLILAPRHPERVKEVETLLQEKGLDYQKRSRPAGGKRVLLLDTVGELARLYGVGTVAFVGGSLVPTGGHNILEPAVYGVPVVFGPHMENFPEISAVMEERRGGIQVSDGQELAAVLGRLLGNGEERESLGQAGMAVMQENQGSLEKNLKLIAELMP